jgi:hypothetical protein
MPTHPFLIPAVTTEGAFWNYAERVARSWTELEETTDQLDVMAWDGERWHFAEVYFDVDTWDRQLDVLVDGVKYDPSEDVDDARPGVSLQLAFINRETSEERHCAKCRFNAWSGNFANDHHYCHLYRGFIRMTDDGKHLRLPACKESEHTS